MNDFEFFGLNIVLFGILILVVFFYLVFLIRKRRKKDFLHDGKK